jgi:hypothetical protein
MGIQWAVFEVKKETSWGTAEQCIKEGKQAVKMTRLSCHRFRSNQVRLALSLLAYDAMLGRIALLPVRTGKVVKSASAIQSGQRKSVAETVPTNAQFRQSWG